MRLSITSKRQFRLSSRVAAVRALVDVKGGNFMSPVRHQKPLASQDKQTTRKEKLLTRLEKLNLMNADIRSKLSMIDQKFNVFNKNVTTVLDLGFAPGNWTEYAKARLIKLHGTPKDADLDRLPEKCHILGFDLLFSLPPSGVSTMQGNIFSKTAHDNVLRHFQEIALARMVKRSRELAGNRGEEDPVMSYFVKEQNEASITTPVDSLASKFSRLNLKNQKIRQEALQKLEYRPNLVLADLTKPFLQERGFYSMTHTRPYMRISNLESLSKIYSNSEKAGFDLADAALVLCASTLRAGGSLVLRLSWFKWGDPEIVMLHLKLTGLFDNVIPSVEYTKLDSNATISPEIFFICRDKKRDSEYDVDDLF